MHGPILPFRYSYAEIKLNAGAVLIKCKNTLLKVVNTKYDNSIFVFMLVLTMRSMMMHIILKES